MESLDLAEDIWEVVDAASWKKAFRLASKWIGLKDEVSLLDQVMDDLIELTRAERGFLVLREGDEGKVVAARNIDQEDIKGAANELSWTITSEVLQSGNPVLSIDASSDNRFLDSDSVRKLKLKSICCLPLKSEEEIAGAIYLDNRTINNAFTGESIEVLESFCELASQFVKNFRAVQKLKERSEILTENCRKLISNNTQLTREKQSLEAQLEFHMGGDEAGEKKAKSSLNGYRQGSVAKVLLAFLMIGSLALNGCGSTSGGYGGDGFGSSSGGASSGKNSDPVPIFGSTKSLTLSVTGFFSGEGYGLHFDTIDLTVSGVSLTPEVSAAKSLAVTKGVSKGIGEPEVFSFDDPFTVRVLDGGEFVTADIVSLEVQEDSYESIEVTFSEMTITGGDGNGNTFEAIFDLEGNVNADQNIDFNGANEKESSLLFDFDTVAVTLKGIIANLPYKNFGHLMINLKDYKKDLWSSMNDAFHVAADLYENGEISKEEFDEFKALRQELRQTLNDLQQTLFVLQQATADSGNNGGAVNNNNGGGGNGNNATTTTTTTTATPTTTTTTNANANANANATTNAKGKKK